MLRTNKKVVVSGDWSAILTENESLFEGFQIESFEIENFEICFISSHPIKTVKLIIMMDTHYFIFTNRCLSIKTFKLIC